MKKLLVLGLGALVTSLAVLFGFAGTARATVNCPIGTDLGTECQVSSTLVIAGGTYSFGETLHVTSTGHIDVATGSGGATFNINAASGLKLVVDGGGIIEAQDDQGSVAPCGTGGGNGPPSGNSACPLTFVTSGDVLLKAGSLISTNELTDGGSSANITMTVGGNMTMCGPAGAHAGCGGASSSPGAKILAEKLGDTGAGLPGNITITVGSLANVTGDFYMEGGDTTYGAETGALIDTTAATKAGDISITSGHSYFTEPGSVVQAGGHNQTATGAGGKIYIVTGCVLTTEGRVTSKGPDFGADLVHLEGCDVFVRGLVESTGKGHVTDAKNSCDGVVDGLPGEVSRPDHPANSTGCVEIWGKNVTIDAGNPWAGELNADIGDGGAGGTGWIDVFAVLSLTVVDGAGNDRDSDNFGHLYHSTYAVHANSVDGSDGTPGQVRAFVTSGPLTGSQPQSTTLGGVFEASATMNNDTGHGAVNTFVGNGSAGGTIDLEASGAVTLDTSWVNASGDYVGTPPPGGHIIASAWGAGSNLSWQNGYGNVKPPTGDIKLNACGGTITTTGTNFNGEVPSPSTNCNASNPVLPSYAASALADDAAIWARCNQQPAFSISGTKHLNNLQGAGLPGWTINLDDSAGVFITSTVTDGSGNYTFAPVSPGTYHICEVKQVGWTQTAPVPGPGVITCINPGEATNGYTVTIGPNATGKDFANTQVADCKEDQNNASKMTRVVDNTGKTHGPAPVYATIQAAYNAAANSGEVIGVFTNSTENLYLGGAKTLLITQCESARVTAADNSKPVWDITSTGKLTINGPDSWGGTVGWLIETPNQTIKAVRAYNASQYGVWIKTNGNNASFNEVAGSPVGIQVDGGSNTLKSGTIDKNGTGVVLAGTGNTLDGSTVGPNTGNGVVVNGSNNTVKGVTATQNGGDGFVANGTGTLFDSNKARKNTGSGFTVAASGSKFKSNSSNDGNAGGSNENGGYEYKFGVAITNQGSNKINNNAFTATAAGNYE